MTTYRLWPSTDGPGSQVSDGTNYTLGVEFYSSATGCTVTEIRFWASATVTSSDHACRIYQVGNGTPLTGSSKALPSPLQAGWNTVTLDSPVAITQNTRYLACVYFTTDDGYTVTGSYWTSGAGASGITNSPLVAPNNAGATGPGQGCFKVDGDTIPDSTFNGGNYWIDVTIDDGAGGADEGALAGATPASSGALTGSVIDSGVLAGVTPTSTGALTGSVVDSGVLAGATSAPVGGLAATVTVAGALAGVTAAPVGALFATPPIEGALAGTTPAPTGALAGTVRVSSLLAGATSPPSGTLTDQVQVAVVDYPLRAGTVTDNLARFRGGVLVDHVAHLGAGVVTIGDYTDLPSGQDPYPPDYAETY